MPACQNCGESSSTYGTFYTNNCNKPKNCISTDATCVIYTGPTLSFIGVTPDTNLENILIKIDEKFSDLTTGDNISSYNTHCLNNGDPYTNMKEYIEGFSEEYCNLVTTVTDLGVELNTQVTSISGRLTNLESPSISSCAFIGINFGDDFKDVDNKQNTAICTLYSYTNIEDVDWGIGVTPPTNLSTAVQLIWNTIKDTGYELPVINNIGSCLPNANNANDSIVDTVIDLRDEFCNLKTFTTAPFIAAQCLTVPTTIKELYTFSYDNIVSLSKSRPIFDSNHFTVIPQSNLCDGKSVTISNNILGKVKTTSTDTLDYLNTKIVAGANVTVSTVANKIVIAATGGGSGVEDKRVSVTENDTTPGYLANKIGMIGAGFLSWNEVVENSSADERLNYTPVIDYNALALSILNTINDNPELKTLFCSMVTDCITSVDPDVKPTITAVTPLY